jgi:hypothetical protein
LLTANVTAAAVFRTVEAAGPTLLFDEADTFLRDSEDLRGILNAGHKRGGQVIRCVGDDAEPRAFAVFAPAAIAAIGRLPGTIEDRSILVRMKRAIRSERPEPLDTAAEAGGAELASRCARWVADHTDRLREADPALPAGLFNRAADNWRPLFAVADVAGGPWPAGIREIAAHAAATRTDQSVRAMLLADIKTVFASRGTDRLSSDELTAYLVSLDDRPWVEWKLGRPLSKSGLARLLSPFGILSDTIRVSSDHTAKGYYFRSFEDAFSRYLSSENVTT